MKLERTILRANRPAEREQSQVKVKAKVKSGKEAPVRFESTVSVGRQIVSSPKTVYRFVVQHDDGGITIDMRDDHTLNDLMEIICSEWLNFLRNGDGLFDEHDWMIRGPSLVDPRHLQSPTKDRRTKESRKVEQLAEISRQNIFPETKLCFIEGLEEGQSLKVLYDFENRTEFEVSFDSKYRPRSENNFPKVVASDADRLARSLIRYTCSTNINEIFPRLSATMFQCGERWVCPFPSSPSNGGFIAGEFQRFYDVLFLPYKASSLQEALVIMESAMKDHPETTGGKDCRIGLPIKLTAAKETKYCLYLEDPRSVNRLVPNLNFTSVLESPRKIAYRINESHMAKYPDIMERMFPLCAKNYRMGRWAFYRNRKVVIAVGNDKGGKLRGVPSQILADVSHRVRSLHEFFCVCESLFALREVVDVFENFQGLSLK